MEKGKGKKGEFGFGIILVILCFAIAMAFLTNIPGSACGAEKYPTSPVDVIVPVAAGGSTDLLARFIAAELSKKWGQPVNVVNKPGGGCVPGTQAAVGAAPNGYTLLMDGPASSSCQMGLKDLPYDILNRTFLARAIFVPMVIISSMKAPWNNLQELAAAGRRDPSSVVWGATAGGRGASDLAFLGYLEAAGIDASKARKVEFTGSAPAVNALAGDHIKLHAAGPAVVNPLVSSGKAKAFGITSTKRSSILPDCPTTQEAGFPAANYQWWGGISGPPGIPAHVQETIVKAIEEIFKAPGIEDKLEKTYCAAPALLRPEAYKQYVQGEGNLIMRMQKFMLGSK